MRIKQFKVTECDKMFPRQKSQTLSLAKKRKAITKIKITDLMKPDSALKIRVHAFIHTPLGNIKHDKTFSYNLITFNGPKPFV